MTREQYVEICKRCQNRQFSSQSGLICSLTNKIAEFKNKCLDFKLDKKENQKIIEKSLIEKLDNPHEITSIIQTYSSKKYFKSKPALTNSVTIEPKSVLGILCYILLPDLLLLLFVLYEFYNANYNFNAIRRYLTLLIFFLLGNVPLIGIFTAQHQNFSFTIKPKGVVIKNKDYKWNSIYTYLIIRRPQGIYGLFPKKSIVFVTIDGTEIEEQNVSNFKMKPNEIMDLIEKMKHDVVTRA